MKASQFLLKKNIGIFAVIVVVAVVVIVNIVNIGDRPKELAEEPKKCLELRGTGKQTYDIRTDKPSSLQIVQVDVDPIDVKEGDTQVITVKVKDDGNNTITTKSGVFANIITDNTTATVSSFVMRLAEDSEDGSSLFTIWEGSWTRQDSSCHTYMETITATNDKGDKVSVALSFK